MRKFTVNTHTRRIISTDVTLLDEEGDSLAMLPDERDWQPIARLKDKPFSIPIAAIDRITSLVDREQDHWNRVYGAR